MDQDRAIQLLRGGRVFVREWNDWRKKGRPLPDLSEANLTGADLSGANLIDANLSGADFTRADLSGAFLRDAILVESCFANAHLWRAKLCGADLSRAILRDANLGDADLQGVLLKEANLNGARIEGADLSDVDLRDTLLLDTIIQNTALSKADFTGAWCQGTVFASVDLSSAKGLATVGHRGPSTIGTDTVYMSRGKIPRAFLEGCGVPNALIEYLPSLLGAQEAIQFYSCFISYSHKDEEFAKRLHSRMRAEHLRVWYAPEDIQGGKKTYEQVEDAIRVHDKLLLVLSPHSMESEWVKSEIATARQREIREKRRVLFPIGLVDLDTIKQWKYFDSDIGKDSAREVREYHIPDFSNWKDHDSFERGFAKLLRDMKNE